jgi:hypothetical protein
MRIARRLTGKHRDTEYVILVASPREQIFREHATVFRYTLRVLLVLEMKLETSRKRLGVTMLL